jgi:thioredoxin-like negative regulator of GroEL
MVRRNGTNLFIALIIGLGIVVPSVAQAQPKPVAPTSPNTLDSSVFSLNGADRLVSEAMDAVTKQNYDLAATKLQDARQVYNQLSNFYQDLVGSFTGLDNRIADSHRQRALQAAQLRDKSTYQLALVYRAKNQPELAIPLLVQLVRSQQPSRDLGKQAYQQLFELGFVEEIFPRASTVTGTTPPKP